MPTSFARARKQLVEHVAQLVRLNTPKPNGWTRRDEIERSLHAVKNMKGDLSRFASLQDELKPVELEPGTRDILVMFDQMNRCRQHGMAGAMPISYVEIKAYCDVMNVQLHRWEAETLRAMDDAYLHEGYLFRKENEPA